MLNTVINILTSLKLTVVTLCLSLVLVFVGTMAQDPLGLYIAQERFFHSLFVDGAAMKAGLEKTLQMVGVYVSAPTTGADVLSATRIPVFPGGYLLGGLLLVNLIAAHIKRFKFTKARSGIFLTHVGLILLLVGQLFTDVFSTESTMRLEVGETRNYSEDSRKDELVFIDRSDPNHDAVIAIPAYRLKPGAVITHPDMPFKVKVHQFWKNADIAGTAQPGFLKVDADKGIGPQVHVRELSAVTAMEQRNLPAAVIEVIKDDQPLGKWFTALTLARTQSVPAGGKDWEFSLRFKRYYEPYTITLLEAKHDKYKGTDIPRNFSSVVRVENPLTTENRETKIFMNNPLRYEGNTYYQYQMAADEMFLRPGETPTSTLQIVQNPTWLTPYLGCLMVGLGLCIQFLIHLVKFARRRKTA